MPRKTKAEKFAEREAQRQLEVEQYQQEYVPLLMKWLEQAQRFGYEVGVKEGKLTLTQPFIGKQSSHLVWSGTGSTIVRWKNWKCVSFS